MKHLSSFIQPFQTCISGTQNKMVSTLFNTMKTGAANCWKL